MDKGDKTRLNRLEIDLGVQRESTYRMETLSDGSIRFIGPTGSVTLPPKSIVNIDGIGRPTHAIVQAGAELDAPGGLHVTAISGIDLAEDI